MNKKMILSAGLAAVIAAVSTASASAAQLTESNRSGQTEVTARIEGADPGEVSYIIEIPDVVDFGMLTRPDVDDEDSYKNVEYTVEAAEINNLDPNNQQISVYVRDQNATVDGDQHFYITNKADSSKKFFYNVFDCEEGSITNSTDNIDSNTMTSAAGYYLTGFTAEGESLTGTLRLNQVQLYPHDLKDIVGDYSGYMVFYSMIEDK